MYLNCLASASGAYGSQSYTYDGVGNRLTRVLGGATETYAYTTGANQVATITTPSNTRSFSYLASGQVSQDVRDSADTYTFAANDNGRNASAALNGTTAGAYLYNAFEQRVQKTVGSAVTQFVVNRFGHLLAAANGSGAAQKEYIWLDDVPVAMVNDTAAAPVLYFIHTDQLGTPQKVTGPGGSIVWDNTSDPFGNPQFVSGGGVWGTSVWGSFTWGADLSLTNLRFPGQYADAETALNQNWFRDYDPTVGRYIQSDPFQGNLGSNNYSYVNGNPLSLIDRTGEQAALAWCFGGPAGCAAGVALTAATIWAMSPQGQKAAKNAGKALTQESCPEDRCYTRWQSERGRCFARFPRGADPRFRQGCLDRAQDRFTLCVGNGGFPNPNEPPEWGPADEEVGRP